jgi:cardiolipin synthase
MRLLLYLAGLAINALTSLHVVLYKRDARAAAGWIGLIWLAPLGVGPVLYFLLGINRIRRKARRLMDSGALGRAPGGVPGGAPERPALPPRPVEPLAALREVGDRVNPWPLLPGNIVTPLVNGDAAFPAMLEAIRGARRSVTLTTFLFGNDPLGREFVDALAQAHARQVAVRVLVDWVGLHYSFPSVRGRLRAAGVPMATFLPSRQPWQGGLLNLRSHRKLLVVDGAVAFTGGMNLRQGHWLGRNPPRPIADLHFRVEGPVVGSLQEVFAGDWEYAAGERLEGDPWFPAASGGAPGGEVLARAVPDGPDSESERIRWLIQGALAAARRSVLVMTPYFVPDTGLVTVLNTAALRGVATEIILPERSNLAWVQWASRAMLWQVLEKGCRIWFSPPPFEHTKLLIVDSRWVLCGSSNWDHRSLRLNFELDLECFDDRLAAGLEGYFRGRQAGSREVTLHEMDSRPLPARVRDGVARLLSPYL